MIKLCIDIVKDAIHVLERKFYLSLLLMVAVALTDGISMAMLFPLLSSLGFGDGDSGSIGQFMHSTFALIGIELTLVNIVIIVFTAFLLQMGLLLTQNWVVSAHQKDYIAYWQVRLFKGIVDANWRYLTKQKTGDMTNYIVTEVPRAGAAFFSIVQLLSATIVGLIYLTVSLMVSWNITVIIFFTALMLMFLARPIQKRSFYFGSKLGGINSSIQSILTEVFSGLKFVKATASNEYAVSRLNIFIDQLRHCLTWSAFLATAIRPIFELTTILVILGLLIWGVGNESIESSQLLVVIAIFARFFPRIMQFQTYLNSLSLYVPAFTLIRNFDQQLKLEKEKINTTARVDEFGHWLDETPKIEIENLNVEFEKKTILSDINLQIKQGEFVAFVGPSGAGKSTLLDCIVGLTKPQEGTIKINDKLLDEDDLYYWRSSIGFAGQDIVLFHDTVEQNILWGRDSMQNSVVDSAVKASANDFIKEMPDGYLTELGDRGVNISGGQRQRIGLARALLGSPGLLILDEATSALDSVSEKKIVGLLDEYKGKATILLVAHRLSTVRNADRIFVIENGRIKNFGNWETLMKNCELFKSLVAAHSVD